MAVVSALPPYGVLDAHSVQCIAQASVRYQVPELLLHAIIRQEGGRTGQCVRNTNGSYDCGLAQINTSWASYFARMGVPYREIASNACVNIYTSAYILRYNYDLKKNWFYAIMAYNIGPSSWTPQRYSIGWKYADHVVKYWWQFQDWVNAHTSYTRRKEQPFSFPAPALSATQTASTAR